ncbi:hypothetical protein [Micromonospora eburnea]|uniref:Antibiotic biosynthesis monooxygenase n=1 Tax=Micromonospora eburnea TaxID=227316 RepID=A0A1C6UZS1_9ACTN|nr:hypothetical protein [Micromonospora eburnea]SCL59526.1 hypothetical protein GA0070604_4076 [Micromonospora eburnea]
MTLIRTTRFTADPADADTVLERRSNLLAAVRAAFTGPTETRLIRLDERTWVDMWRWDSPETLQAALAGAPSLPEAAAAFAVARDVSAEQGELVDEDGWTR